VRPSAAPTRTTGTFRVQDNSRTMAGSTPLPSPAMPSRTATEPMRAYTGEQAATPTLIEEIASEVLTPEPPAPEPAFDPEATIMAPSIDRRMIADAPVEEARTAPEPLPEEPPYVEPAPEPSVEPVSEQPQARDFFPDASAAEPAVPEAPEAPAPVANDDFAPLALEPEVDFNEAEKPQKKPDVKTVKVRSSVDVMAELEALRKRATNTSAKTPKRDVLADLDSLRPKRDLTRTLHVQLPTGVLSRTKSVRVTLSFEDGEEGIIDTQNQQLELGDASDVQSLSVNLKIDLA
jgi:hypothetical protein